MHAPPPKTTYDEIDIPPKGWWELKLIANDFGSLRSAQKFAQRLTTPEQRARFWKDNPWQKTTPPKTKKAKTLKKSPPKPA